MWMWSSVADIWPWSCVSFSKWAELDSSHAVALHGVLDACPVIRRLSRGRLLPAGLTPMSHGFCLRGKAQTFAQDESISRRLALIGRYFPKRFVTLVSYWLKQLNWPSQGLLWKGATGRRTQPSVIWNHVPQTSTTRAACVVLPDTNTCFVMKLKVF